MDILTITGGGECDRGIHVGFRRFLKEADGKIYYMESCGCGGFVVAKEYLCEKHELRNAFFYGKTLVVSVVNRDVVRRFKEVLRDIVRMSIYVG
jgi:hypothetical protein